MRAHRQAFVWILILAGSLVAAAPAFAGAHGKWAPRYVEDEPEGETVTLIHDSSMKEGESVISAANDNPNAESVADIHAFEATESPKAPTGNVSESEAKQAIAEIPAPANENAEAEAASAKGDTVISDATSPIADPTEEGEKAILISSADAPQGRAPEPTQSQPEKSRSEASIRQPPPSKRGGNVVVDNGQNGETVNVGVVSWRDLPFQTVLRQAFDFSCGSAAVATLMTFAYGMPVREIDVFRDMFTNGDQAKIRREGFSMLDMSNYLNSKGLVAKGYKIAADAIAAYRVPFIALINTHGYNHFVVVKSMGKGRVLVGDPNLGNTDYSIDAFSKIWNGLALVVVNNASRSRQAFANPDEWRFARSHVTPRDSNDLSTAAASLPAFNWQIGQISSELLPAALANMSSATPTGGNL